MSIFQQNDILGFWPLIIGGVILLLLEFIAYEISQWMDFQFRFSKLMIFAYITIFNIMICYQAVVSVHSFLISFVSQTL